MQSGPICSTVGLPMMLPNGGMTSLRKGMTLMMIILPSADMMWKRSPKSSILKTAVKAKEKKDFMAA